MKKLSSRIKLLTIRYHDLITDDYRGGAKDRQEFKVLKFGCRGPAVHQNTENGENIEDNEKCAITAVRLLPIEIRVASPWSPLYATPATPAEFHN